MLQRVMVLGLLGVLTVGLRAAPSEAMKAVVTAYLDIQTQLAGDTMDTVPARARTIGEHAAQMGQPGTAIAVAAAAVEKATDLNAAREAFGGLSDAVIAAAKADGWADVKDLKLAYCPMAKRSWLQAQPTVENPYYGKAMSNCGEIRKLQ